MANPVVTAIPIDVWTKVATAKTAGAIIPLKNLSGGNYVQTTRVTTDPPPTDGSTAEGVKIPMEGSIINSSSSIDVYVAVVGDIAGSVRVDL